MSVDLVIPLVAILLAALATGGLMVNWIGLARAMARVSSASGYTEFHQATNRTFQPYMPIVVFRCFRRHRARSGLFRSESRIRSTRDGGRRLLCRRNCD
jgi:hypothetical protein